MGWYENEQGVCCASIHCGQQMRFSWPQPWCGVREIQFTMILSVSTNGYERQLGARGFISFRGGRSIGFRINPPYGWQAIERGKGVRILSPLSCTG